MKVYNYRESLSRFDDVEDLLEAEVVVWLDATIDYFHNPEIAITDFKEQIVKVVVLTVLNSTTQIQASV